MPFAFPSESAFAFAGIPTDIDHGAIVESGGPAGPYTISDLGDVNIQNDSTIRFDVYRWDTNANALKFGKQPYTATVTFPAASGGGCPGGWTVKP
jgi:hypothetical protein